MLPIVCLSGTSHASNPGTEGPKVSVSFEIGKGSFCTGWGLCYIEITVGVKMGYVETNGGGSWILSLPKDVLAKYEPDALVHVDGKSSVTFDEPFVLPAEINKAVGAEQDLMIKANVKYQVSFENGYYRIFFNN